MRDWRLEGWADWKAEDGRVRQKSILERVSPLKEVGIA